MLVKANVLLYLDTADGDHEERATAIGMALENGLSGLINNSGFPEGDVVTVDVESVLPVSDEEAEEKGLVE